MPRRVDATRPIDISIVLPHVIFKECLCHGTGMPPGVSWEREDTRIEVEGYKWFGKPRNNQTSQRGLAF